MLPVRKRSRAAATTTTNAQAMVIFAPTANPASTAPRYRIRLSPISRNTMNVTINFTSSSPTTNTNLMWEQIFKDAANRTGGIPNEMFVTDATANGAYITINGLYSPPNNQANIPDINLKVNAVNLTASILSISGV